jgi:hypothetical protein
MADFRFIIFAEGPIPDRVLPSLSDLRSLGLISTGRRIGGGRFRSWFHARLDRLKLLWGPHSLSRSFDESRIAFEVSESSDAVDRLTERHVEMLDCAVFGLVIFEASVPDPVGSSAHVSDAAGCEEAYIRSSPSPLVDMTRTKPSFLVSIQTGDDAELLNAPSPGGRGQETLPQCYS